MITRAPLAINKMTRMVVMRHPNAYNCNIYRKVINRAGPLSGGLPTIGGMGVISSEDEADISYQHIGDGFLLGVDPFAAASMMERQDESNGMGETTFLVAPEDETVVIKKNDIIYRIHGNVVKMAFEVVDIIDKVSIPPFCLHYICNRRDDLHALIIP